MTQRWYGQGRCVCVCVCVCNLFSNKELHSQKNPVLVRMLWCPGLKTFNVFPELAFRMSSQIQNRACVWTVGVCLPVTPTRQSKGLQTLQVVWLPWAIGLAAWDSLSRPKLEVKDTGPHDNNSSRSQHRTQ